MENSRDGAVNASASRYDLGPVIIAGGGIGGLALALALAEYGIACTVLERAVRFSEVGAGIQLGPNAINAFERLGLGDSLVKAGFVPSVMEMRSLSDGRLLKQTFLGETAIDHFGAPYVMAYRPDILDRLLARAMKAPSIKLCRGCEVSHYEQDDNSVRVFLKDGGISAGRLLIGCDGLHSAVRRQLVGDGEPVASKRVGFRIKLPREAIPDTCWYSQPVIWVGAGIHIVHYPLRGGHWLNAVVCRTIDPDESDEGNPVHQLTGTLTRLARSPSPLLRLLAESEPWSQKRLYDREPVNRWVDGRVALLGDAAHPMLPHLAQGAAMAVEDALVLARELTVSPDNPEVAFSRYAAERQPRTHRIQALARVYGDLYHQGGDSFADKTIQTLGEMNWIYNFKVS